MEHSLGPGIKSSHLKHKLWTNEAVTQKERMNTLTMQMDNTVHFNQGLLTGYS